ncbi:Skp1 family, dimerization domain containing protein [Nitzschia inconspicua]|uniref:Skp1 family, dimerization domain containing protein n=1 Tax=Nitzschia inconspicua TaxID=303405 RepID=A0A9K3M8N0_9STRA|nr:Skp1 family, dimerization domain containing protein [Nitzschia inconspicua]KAG7374266.1 Skp1 family, dimerization domain containing protein [Nitzschia inconspicua]
MADEMDNIMLRLKSMPDENGNSREFEISYGAAKLSELIKDSVGDDFEEDDTMPEIDVPRVKGDCLEKVVSFLQHYRKEPMKEIPTPLGGSSFNEVMDQEWYQQFVDDSNLGSRDMLFDLLTAANFMGIKELLDLTCLKVTFQLTGKNAEEIRQILRLPELTPEEEAQAREDHKWIFEEN